MTLQEVTNVAVVAYAGLFLISLGFLIWQVRLQSRALRAQTFATFLLGNQALLEDRQVLYGVKSKPNIKDWTDRESTSVRKVCNGFDIAGIMVQEGFLEA